MKFLHYFLILGLFVACDKDENKSYGFVESSGTMSEGDGQKSISIDLGRRVTAGTTINYLVAGSAFLNGDYEINGPASLTSGTFVVSAKTGASTVTIPITPIDDSHIEQETESIFFLITGSSDVELSKVLRKNQYVLEITDNDTPPASGLQVDLSWYTGDGISVNTANFDLYLANNLAFDSLGLLETFDLVEGYESKNTRGFESLIINEDLMDGEYYILIKFVDGATEAEVYLHMSQGDRYGTASGHVNTSYVGKQVYYGPITKTGNTFGFEQ